MTYGLSTRASIEDGPVEQVAKAIAAARPRAPGARSTTPAAWSRSSRRFAPANDRIDGFPLAL